MNLDAATLERLMAYADGELEGAERAEIEALVQSNEDAARVVSELGTLGDVVRTVEDARSSRLAAADGIADAVMAKIQSEQAAPPARTSTRPASTSVRPAPVIDLAARRRRNYGLVAALVAAAAAVVFIARPHDDEGSSPTATAPTTATSPTTSAAPLPTVTAPATAVASAEPAPAPSEAPSNVSVIVVPSEGNTAPSVVIWLGDDTAGGPVK